MYLLPLLFPPKLADHQLTEEVVCFIQYLLLDLASSLIPTRFRLNDSSSDRWILKNYLQLVLVYVNILV